MEASQRVEHGGRSGVRTGLRHCPIIRQASVWEPGSRPHRVSLTELADSDAIRWLDLYAGEISGSEALALLDPICRGELNARMVRDLIMPGRFPAGRTYPGGAVSITAAFRTRHLQSKAEGAEPGDVTSVFEPVHLLVAEGWMISCWLPPRVFRGEREALRDDEEAANSLYEAVADRWPASDGETPADLADLVRRQLAIAAGYRVQPER
jgi:hypothetical protein